MNYKTPTILSYSFVAQADTHTLTPSQMGAWFPWLFPQGHISRAYNTYRSSLQDSKGSLAVLQYLIYMEHKLL